LVTGKIQSHLAGSALKRHFASLRKHRPATARTVYGNEITLISFPFEQPTVTLDKLIVGRYGLLKLAKSLIQCGICLLKCSYNSFLLIELSLSMGRHARQDKALYFALVDLLPALRHLAAMDSYKLPRLFDYECRFENDTVGFFTLGLVCSDPSSEIQNAFGHSLRAWTSDCGRKD